MSFLKIIGKIIFGVLLLSLVGFGLWQGIRSFSGDSSSVAVPGLEVVSERRTIEETILLTGEVRPLNQTEVRSEISGRIETIHRREGDLVQRGDLLITLDQVSLRTQLREAQRNLQAAQLRFEKAQRDYQRLARLFASEFIRENDYLDAKTDYELSGIELEIRQARLEASEEDLARSVIRSPGDGIITGLDVNEGQVIVGATSVSNGTLLMTVDDFSQMYIELEVNEIDIQQVKKGQLARIRMDALPDLTLEGHIDFIAPSARTRGNRRVFPVQIRFDVTDPRVRPGLSTSVHLPIKQAPDTVAVLVSAVFRDQRERVVFVRGSDGSLERRVVETGISDNQFVQIISGLNEGERLSLTRPTAL
jgi:RND family efflux transporter MFP subunit